MKSEEYEALAIEKIDYMRSNGDFNPVVEHYNVHLTMAQVYATLSLAAAIRASYGG